MKNLTIIVATALLASACTWVKPSMEGADVMVSDAAAASSCRAMGSVTARTKSTIAGVARNEEKLASELDTLARNEAAALGADTVVPVSEIEAGQRRYNAYLCKTDA